MNRDLAHFLRLGLMRIRHRTTELAAIEAPPETLQAKQEIETLQILEDLIMEQVPYENTDHSAR